MPVGLPNRHQVFFYHRYDYTRIKRKKGIQTIMLWGMRMRTTFEFRQMVFPVSHHSSYSNLSFRFIFQTQVSVCGNGVLDNKNSDVEINMKVDTFLHLTFALKKKLLVSVVGCCGKILNFKNINVEKKTVKSIRDSVSQGFVVGLWLVVVFIAYKASLDSNS